MIMHAAVEQREFRPWDVEQLMISVTLYTVHLAHSLSTEEVKVRVDSEIVLCCGPGLSQTQ